MTGQAPDREALARFGEAHRLTTPVQCACGWRETDPDAGTYGEHIADRLAQVVREAEQRGYERALVDVSERSDDGIEFGPDNYRRLLRMLRDVSARHAGADQ